MYPPTPHNPLPAPLARRTFLSHTACGIGAAALSSLLKQSVVRAADASPPADLGATCAIGVAGTVTTLATLELGLEAEDPSLLHGHRM